MYIGQTPSTGAYKLCDAITTSSTATYNLTVGSVATTPETANHCIVSLNGVIQAPISAFTIVGSTIVFASSLTSADVVDFILILGDVMSIGTPSDDTVTLAKMASGTDGNIISYDASGNPVAISTGNDGQVLTSAGAGQPPAFEAVSAGANTPYFQAVQSSDVSLTASTATLIAMNSEPYDSGSLFASGKFTMDASNAGKYFCYCKISVSTDSNYTSTGNYCELLLRHYNSGDSLLFSHSARMSFAMCHFPTVQVSGFFNLANGDYVVPYVTITGSGSVAIGVDTTSPAKLEFTAFQIIE